jgi:general secretion pathway protein J
MTNRPRSRTTGATAGFTLLETLIAMMLMGVILAALATITGQWMPSWNHGMARIQRDEQLALGLERLAADLAAAEFVSISRETKEPYFDGTEHAITFVRTALGPNAGSELELVRIAETRSEQGPVVVRMRSALAPAVVNFGRRNLPQFANPVVLVRPPYRLAFSYAGADRIWQDKWSRQIRLPTAIKLTVRDSNRGTYSASTAVLLHMVIPQSCIATKSVDDCLTSLKPQDSRTRT